MSREASAKSLLPTHDRASVVQIAKTLVVCDQKDTAPPGGDILPQRGLKTILKPSTKKATNFWSIEMSDKVRNRSA